MFWLPRKKTYEVRVKVSVRIPRDDLPQPEDMVYGPMRCDGCHSWGDLVHLEFVGEIKAHTRWAVASHACRHLNPVIGDETEIVLYIEEKPVVRRDVP
jgi:hypothetical protein